MYWTIFILFCTVIMAIIGFLGIGNGPILTAQVIFYVLLISLVSCIIWESSKRKSKRPE